MHHMDARLNGAAPFLHLAPAMDGGPPAVRILLQRLKARRRPAYVGGAPAPVPADEAVLATELVPTVLALALGPVDAAADEPLLQWLTATLTAMEPSEPPSAAPVASAPSTASADEAAAEGAGHALSALLTSAVLHIHVDGGRALLTGKRDASRASVATAVEVALPAIALRTVDAGLGGAAPVDGGPELWTRPATDHLPWRRTGSGPAPTSLRASLRWRGVHVVLPEHVLPSPFVLSPSAALLSGEPSTVRIAKADATQRDTIALVAPVTATVTVGRRSGSFSRPAPLAAVPA